MSTTIFSATPQQAADAAAAALAEGFLPADLGEAISLAANQLILRDLGRTPRDEVPENRQEASTVIRSACTRAIRRTPGGTWRESSNTRNSFASLILGAYQVALDRIGRGGDFIRWEPLPIARHLAEIKAADADGLIREADEAIRGNLQAKASAVIHRYGQLDTHLGRCSTCCCATR